MSIGSTAFVSDSPGWFGKLPALGDFASRRLPDRFIARWDAWLQNGLLESRVVLGAQWLPTYLQGPILRFRIAAGVIDADGWQGVLMPSVDRVGRHFPLSIAAVCDAPVTDAWFTALEDCALQVLAMEQTVEDFEAALARVKRNVPVEDAVFPAVVPAVFQLGLPVFGESVWWDRDAIALRCAGLPTPQQFVMLLTGDRGSNYDPHRPF